MGRIVKAASGTAAERVEALLAAARDEALATRMAARAEAARVREEALELGRRQAAETVAEALAAVEAERQRIRAEADGEIVELAVAIAGRILACAVEDGRAAVETARRALARSRRTREATLRAHPDDASALRAAAAELARSAGGARSLAVREDPAVGRGGLVLETGAGILDARLEAQLATIRRRLEEAA